MKVNFFQIILNACGAYKPSWVNAALNENWWPMLACRPVFYIRR